MRSKSPAASVTGWAGPNGAFSMARKSPSGMARTSGSAAEFGQRERRLQRPFGSERIEHVGDCRGVSADRAVRHRSGDRGGVPYGEVGAVSPGGCGESVMLHRHVGEQLGEAPSGARRG